MRSDQNELLTRVGPGTTGSNLCERVGQRSDPLLEASGILFGWFGAEGSAPPPFPGFPLSEALAITQMHLGTSDKAIIANRRRLLQAVEAVPAGAWGTRWQERAQARRAGAPWLRDAVRAAEVQAS